MNTFTYESTDQKTPLEQYEWDNTWWETTGDITTPRVLYIGDSISCGIRRLATECSGNKFLFDGFGSSKAVDHPYLSHSIQLFAKQQNSRKIILFNNGLHGWHLDDATEYKNHFEKQVQFLLNEFYDTTVALVLTTCIGGERNQRVIARNRYVKEIAEKYNLPIIDLYTVSVENIHLQCDDKVHFTLEGYRIFAKKILTDINKF